MRNGTPGFPGIAGILGAVIGVGLLMSLLFGDVMQWIPIILAVIVSLRAVQRVKK